MNVIQITNLNQYVSMAAKLTGFRDGIASKLAPNNSKAKKDAYIPAGKKQESAEEKGVKLGRIFAKMHAGKKLSSVEMEYLRQNAPEWYEKARKIEKEREEYRRALENCKTKDEVRLLHTQRMSQIMAEMKAAKANKYSEQLLGMIAMKATALVNEFNDFTQSDEYSEKPNEYEIVAEKKENQNQNGEDDIELENEYDEKAPSDEIKTPNSSDSSGNKKADKMEEVYKPPVLLRGKKSVSYCASETKDVEFVK
jgi:hypothetical protein